MNSTITKTYKLFCLLLTVIFILFECGETATESSTPAESLDTSSTAEESVTEKEPVRYTYAEEATVYDVTEKYYAGYSGFRYLGGDTVVCSARQNELAESKIMLLYDLETGEFSKSYTPKNPTENLCESFFVSEKTASLVWPVGLENACGSTRRAIIWALTCGLMTMIFLRNTTH